MNGAARPDLWTAAPIGLVALSLWSFPPPAEYVLGGKDPGVYFNAGVQIAQRGRLVVHDPLVASLPASSRDLFFPQHVGQAYYSTRFMGFFLLDPLTGAVVDQFPHLYPTAVAIGYGLAGVTGARYTPVACAIVGVLALYFLGARLAGRAAGAGAGGLLALHLVQVWHARVPNSEILAQPLLLAGLLALAHAHQDDDGFFAPIAGVLLGLLPFARFDGVLAVVLACAGLALYWVTGGRVRWGFVLPLGAALLLFVVYLATWLAPYAARPIFWMTLNRWPLTLLLAGAIAALGAGLRLRRSQPVTSAIRRWLPHAMTAVVAVLAAYAWFVRQPGGALAVHDAWSLRQFSWYVHPAAIAAALAGLAILAPRAFWRDPAFFTVACGVGHLRLPPHPHRPRALLGDAALRCHHPARPSSSASRRRCCCRWPRPGGSAQAARSGGSLRAAGSLCSRSWPGRLRRPPRASTVTSSTRASSRGSRRWPRDSPRPTCWSSSRATRRMSMCWRCRWRTSMTGRSWC